MNTKIKELLTKPKELVAILRNRWKSESPIFFKKVYSIMFKLGLSAVGVLVMNKFAGLQELGVPSIVFTACGYVLTACAAIGLTAKLTKNDLTNNI